MLDSYLNRDQLIAEARAIAGCYWDKFYKTVFVGDKEDLQSAAVVAVLEWEREQLAAGTEPDKLSETEAVRVIKKAIGKEARANSRVLDLDGEGKRLLFCLSELATEGDDGEKVEFDVVAKRRRRREYSIEELELFRDEMRKTVGRQTMELMLAFSWQPDCYKKVAEYADALEPNPNETQAQYYERRKSYPHTPEAAKALFDVAKAKLRTRLDPDVVNRIARLP